MLNANISSHTAGRVGLDLRGNIIEFGPTVTFFDKIKQISKKYEAVGIHAFTMDTIEQRSTAHSRNFAPLYGIDEESATGTASGALSSYLFTYHQISTNKYNPIILEQGYIMGKPSEIQVRLDIVNQGIRGVMVGGNAVKVCEKEMQILRNK